MPDQPNILQILSDHGINPFAVQLLVESHEQHEVRHKVSFVLCETRVTLEPAREERADDLPR